ncbi:TIR domain-containing protein [Flavobacterium yafengii]|jgi:uncharacterized protein YdaL|uniref:TIR domain-containing protein n=1 Tax=Flavobacterium yafengii TaxID=3041253 RepID=UPI0024A89697|nr:TIR domain-containing protein [Flavobacterium yafengii]MDI5887663.1 TIR domain-containing protein [Flavobacterium yafengii]
MAREYKIFISHSWKYPDDLKNLRNLLNQRGYFNVEFQEASQEEPINSKNAPYIKKILKNKILNSNVILAISGIYASYSDWIEWEIITSYNNSVPIIGVAPWGQEKISRTVTDYSIADVRWNTESIVNAIKTHAK